MIGTFFPLAFRDRRSLQVYKKTMVGTWYDDQAVFIHWHTMVSRGLQSDSFSRPRLPNFFFGFACRVDQCQRHIHQRLHSYPGFPIRKKPPDCGDGTNLAWSKDGLEHVYTKHLNLSYTIGGSISRGGSNGKGHFWIGQSLRLWERNCRLHGLSAYRDKSSKYRYRASKVQTRSVR